METDLFSLFLLKHTGTIAISLILLSDTLVPLVGFEPTTIPNSFLERASWRHPTCPNDVTISTNEPLIQCIRNFSLLGSPLRMCLGEYPPFPFGTVLCPLSYRGTNYIDYAKLILSQSYRFAHSRRIRRYSAMRSQMGS